MNQWFVASSGISEVIGKNRCGGKHDEFKCDQSRLLQWSPDLFSRPTNIFEYQIMFKHALDDWPKNAHPHQKIDQKSSVAYHAAYNDPYLCFL